jgi:hypothetical protein
MIVMYAGTIIVAEKSSSLPETHCFSTSMKIGIVKIITINAAVKAIIGGNISFSLF